MKIHQLLSGMNMPVSLEENAFIDRYPKTVKISSLTERDAWMARNLVRKGVYAVDEQDDNLLVKR